MKESGERARKTMFPGPLSITYLIQEQDGCFSGALARN